MPVLEKMIELANNIYDVHCDPTGAQWISSKNSHVVKPFSASSERMLLDLVGAYRITYGRVPSSSAARNALRYLAGQNYDGDPIEVAKRVAEIDGTRYVDLGRKDELALVIKAGKPPVVGSTPDDVYFHRGTIHGELPIPKKMPGVSIDDLWDHIRVKKEYRPVILAWMYASWSPKSQSAPVLLLDGVSGSAKSTIERRLLSLLDPFARDTMFGRPSSNAGLIFLLNMSRVIGMDHVSQITPHMQDSLRRAVTGDAFEPRNPYARNGEITPPNLRSAVILSGLDLSAIDRGLAGRAIRIALDLVPMSIWIPDDVLDERWAEVYPGLLWEFAELMGKIMTVTTIPSTQMAGLDRALYAVNRVTGERRTPA